MRRKPVTRDEVRFDGWSHITTLPVDAVRKKSKTKFYDYEIIRRLWTPLLRQLNQAKKQEWQSEPKEHRGKFYSIEYPEVGWRTRFCRHCEKPFYDAFIRDAAGHRHSTYCSDRCMSLAHAPRRAAWLAEFVKARSQQRAEARADLTCQACGKPLKAERSTRKFCSGRCRVAAHRSST